MFRNYRIDEDLFFNNTKNEAVTTSKFFGPTPVASYPKIQQMVRFRNPGDLLVRKGNDHILEHHFTFAGSTKRHLIIQFLTESILLSLFSLVLALGIAVLLLPMFNQLVGNRSIPTRSSAAGSCPSSSSWYYWSVVSQAVIPLFDAGNFAADGSMYARLPIADLAFWLSGKGRFLLPVRERALPLLAL